MSETKHTPGPWVMEKAESSKTGSVHYAVKTAYKPEEHPWSPRFITFMCGGLGDALPSRQPMKDYRDDPQIEADVRLICAAPEMYAALKSMESVDDDPMANGDPRRELLLAAIAKAEGRA